MPGRPTQYGPVAQLVRVPACHAGGRGFESLLGRQSKKRCCCPVMDDSSAFLCCRISGGGKWLTIRKADDTMNQN